MYKNGHLPPPTKRWLTVVYVILIILIPFFGYSQNSCSTAVNHNVGSFQDYNMTTTEYWIKFTATSNELSIYYQQSTNSPQAIISKMVLYTGICGLLQLIDSNNIFDTIIFRNDFTINQEYYLKLEQATALNSNIGFGIYSVPPISNTTLNCETYCNVIPNGKFDNLNNHLLQYWATGGGITNPYYQYYQNPLTANNPNDPLNNSCGWARYSTYNWSTPQIKKEINSGMANYYMYLFSFIDQNNYFYPEVAFTELNNGQILQPGQYYLSFQYREQTGDISSVDFYLSSSTNYFISTASEHIANIPLNSNQWTSVSIPVTITQSNQNYLYFYIVPNMPSSQQPNTYTAMNITDISLIPIDINVSPSTSICIGNEVEISALTCPNSDVPYYNSTFSWYSNPNDNSIANHPIYGDQRHNQTIYVTPQTSTNYTVNITNSLGQLFNEYVLINTYPFVDKPEITGKFHSCNGLEDYLISSFDPNATYYYEIEILGVGNFGPYSINTSTFNIDWNDPTYTDPITGMPLGGGPNWILKTFAYYNQSCISEASFTVYPCCNSCTGSVYTDVTLNSDLMLNNTSICVNGTLTIPANITLFAGSNTFIYMGGNASIIVEDRGTLNMEAATIQSCDQLNMWNEIYLENVNSSLVAYSSNFYDGKTAIHSNNGGLFNIQACEFDKNYTALFAENYNGDHNGYLSSNTIIGGGLNLFPYSGAYAKYGIHLKNLIKSNVNLQIGDATNVIFLNSIRNFNYGLYSINSDFTLRNAELNNNLNSIWIEGNENLPVTNVARSAVIGGTNPNQPININNTQLAIYCTLKSNLNVYNNQINNTYAGIKIENSNGTEINIIDNQISTQLLGIGADFITSNLNIQSNNITPSLTSISTGIKVIENEWGAVQPNISLRTYICSNSIENVQFGIFIINTPKSMISNNTIELYGSNAYGIIEQGSDVLTAGNSIYKSNYTPSGNDIFNLIGIYRGNFCKVDVIDNDIYSVGSGIYVYEHASAIYGLNKLENCYHGFYFDHADIVDQDVYNNEWINNIGPNKMYGEVVLKNPLIEWKYDNTGNYNIQISVVSHLSTVVSNPNSFSYYYSCPTPPPAPPLAPSQLVSISQDSLRTIMVGNTISDVFPSTQNLTSFVIAQLSNSDYNKVAFAYYTLIQNPNLLNLGNINDQFYNNFYNAISQSNIGKQFNALMNLKNGNIKKAEFLINAINPTNFYELNALEVLKFRINQQKGEVISSNDSSNVLAIANMSPVLGGPFVYYGRNSLGIVKLDFGNNKPKSKLNKNTSDILVTEPMFNIYPNPSSGLFTIENNYNIEDYSIEIYDIFGRNIYSAKVYEPKHLFDMSEFDKGIYFIRVINSSNNIIYNSKLIKQ